MNNNDILPVDTEIDQLLQSMLDHIGNFPQPYDIDQEIDNFNRELEHTWTANPMALNIPGIPGIVFNQGPISPLGNTIESDSDGELITPIDLTGFTSESDEEHYASSCDSNIPVCKNSSSQTETDQFCPICFQPLFAHNIVNVPCKHNTCSKCFFRWIRNNPTCPICRLNFTSWDRLTKDNFNTEIEAINDLYKTVLENLVYSVKEEKKIVEKLFDKKKELKDITESCSRRRTMTNFLRGYNHAIMIGENDKIPYCEKAEYCKGYGKGCIERNYFLYAMGIRKHEFLNYHPTRVLYKKIIKNRPVRIIRRARIFKKKILHELLLHPLIKKLNSKQS